MVHGYRSFSGVRLVASYTAGTPGGGTRFENTDDIAIADNNTTGAASSIDSTYGGHVGTVLVEVNIVHTYRGDLAVDLIHPDGTAYNLHNRAGGSANDISQTYSVDVGAKPAAGPWRLWARDLAAADTGYIDRLGDYLRVIAGRAVHPPAGRGRDTPAVVASSPTSMPTPARKSARRWSRRRRGAGICSARTRCGIHEAPSVASPRPPGGAPRYRPVRDETRARVVGGR